MDLIVHGHNFEVSPTVEDYVQKKIRRLDRKIADLSEARMELSVEKARSAADRQIAQITLRTERGTLLRAEERTGDMFSSIDAVLDKITRQIERYKGRGKEKRFRQRRQSAAAARNGGAVAALTQETIAVAEPLIARRKRFTVSPMTEEEAVEQLELLGHPFYLFFDAEEKSLAVLYRRSDGSYGLLLPDIE